jgi:hypothetical protein
MHNILFRRYFAKNPLEYEGRSRKSTHFGAAEDQIIPTLNQLIS